MAKAYEIIAHMDKMAPPFLAEDWDNVGLLVGSKEKEVKSVLLSLDVTSKVVDEAISKNVDMIIAHHPVIFKGLKNVRDDNAQSKLVYRLIRNNINVFAAHTNFDVATENINRRLAKMLNLVNVQNLSVYKTEKLYKIAVFVPRDNADEVRSVMCNAGAGWIGNYKECTFSTNGTGTFMPLEGTNPYIGSQGNLERVNETKVETIVPEYLLKGVVDDMLKVHPYEEVAYDIYPLANEGFQYGLGNVGELIDTYRFNDFLDYLKSAFDLQSLRYTENPPVSVKKVAIFCGSFDEDYIAAVKRHNPDILVTGDIKHHIAIDLIENGICAVDCGHYGTEKVVIGMFKEMLCDKFRDVDFIESQNSDNPIITI